VSDALFSVLSEKRLSTYLNIANQDQKRALELYKLNIRLSESLYPLLSIFEITFRNRLSNFFVKEFGETWFDGSNLSFPLGRPNENYPQGKPNRQFEEIKKIKQQIKNLNKPKNTGAKTIENNEQIITSDMMTARLSFGFWTGVIGRDYERIIWHQENFVREIFIDAPTKYNLKRNFGKIRREINIIREDLRNRISHHEPIFGTSNTLIDLMNNYENAKKYLEWLSKESAEFLKPQDKFPHNISFIPSCIKNSIKQDVKIQDSKILKYY
jgi:hypothetical protein